MNFVTWKDPSKRAKLTCGGKRRTYLGLAWVCVAFVATPATHAQSDLATAHISPTLYFPSAADEASSRVSLHARIAPEVAAITSVRESSLVGELDRCEALLSKLQTHAAFLKVQTLEDTQDQAAKKAREEVDTNQSVLEAAMNARLQRVAPKQAGSPGPLCLTRAERSARCGPRAISGRRTVSRCCLRANTEQLGR